MLRIQSVTNIFCKWQTMFYFITQYAKLCTKIVWKKKTRATNTKTRADYVKQISKG